MGLFSMMKRSLPNEWTRSFSKAFRPERKLRTIAGSRFSSRCNESRVEEIWPGFKNKGVQLLLNGVVNYLPCPTEVQNHALDQNRDEEKVDLEGSSSGSLVDLAFKLEEGRFGQLTYLRIYNGTIRLGEYTINSSTGRKVKDFPLAQAGDIVAVFGIECASGGTTDELRSSESRLYESQKAKEQAPRSQDGDTGRHAHSFTPIMGSGSLYRLMQTRAYSFQSSIELGGWTRVPGSSGGTLLPPSNMRNPFLEGSVRFKSKNKIKKAKQKKREILHKIKRVRIFAKKRKEEMNPEEKLEFRLHRGRKKMELIQQAISKFPVQEIPPKDPDQEVLTAEQMHYLKKIGYKNKNYVPVGCRGIFGGTIQNIHLHWKKHETVQIEIAGFTKDEIKVMADQMARLSGGMLIDIHRANIVILYRGRNYVQPKQLIPIKTLDKRKALALSKLHQSFKALEENDKKVENELHELRKENELRAAGKFIEKIPDPKPKLEDPDEYSDWSSSENSGSDEDDEKVEALISEAMDGAGDEDEDQDYSDFEHSENVKHDAVRF